MKAELFPVWRGGKAGYLYNVTLDGELVLERSRDPECDLARFLLSRGIAGKVTMHDGKTGKPRTIVDIGKASKVYADDNAMRFRPWRPFDRAEGRAVSSYSPEEALVAITLPSTANEAA